MSIEKLPAKEVLEVISEMGFTKGIDAIIVAKVATEKTTNVIECSYAALHFQDKCTHCGRRPVPHLTYSDFKGFKGKPNILLGHFCNRGVGPNNFLYHAFKTLEDWEEWNKEARGKNENPSSD
jgi:hypothetical protein